MKDTSHEHSPSEHDGHSTQSMPGRGGALTVGSTLADQSRIPVLPRVGDRLLKELPCSGRVYKSTEYTLVSPKREKLDLA